MVSAPERLVLACLGALLLAMPAAASAQDGLSEARAAFDAAEFETALAQLDTLDASDALSVDEVAAFLTLRAEVHFALGDAAAMEADLRALLALAPDARLPDTAPPELSEAAERARSEALPLPTVRTEASPIAGGVRLRADIVADGAGLARRARLHARSPGEAWREVEEELEVTGPSVEYWAEALGPGGVVLAQEGSAAAPRRWGSATGGGELDPLVLGLSLGGAAAAVLIVGIVAGVAASGPSDRTQPGLPVLVSF